MKTYTQDCLFTNSFLCTWKATKIITEPMIIAADTKLIAVILLYFFLNFFDLHIKLPFQIIYLTYLLYNI